MLGPAREAYRPHFTPRMVHTALLVTCGALDAMDRRGQTIGRADLLALERELLITGAAIPLEKRLDWTEDDEISY